MEIDLTMQCPRKNLFNDIFGHDSSPLYYERWKTQRAHKINNFCSRKIRLCMKKTSPIS